MSLVRVNHDVLNIVKYLLATIIRYVESSGQAVDVIKLAAPPYRNCNSVSTPGSMCQTINDCENIKINKTKAPRFVHFCDVYCTITIAPCKVTGFPAGNRRNVFLLILESWALESAIQFKEPGIPLTIGIGDTSFTNKESRIHQLESGIQSVELRIVQAT